MRQRKVCLIGDFAVGKTSLFDRFVYNRFSGTYQTTVGVRVQRKVVELGTSTLTLILWDMEGNSNGTATVNESHLLGATGGVLVCDLTRPDTIRSLPTYAATLRRVSPKARVVSAGNKYDLVSARDSTIAMAQQTAAAMEVPLLLTSANTGENVEALFQTLASELLA